ncbi:MAG: SIS domain-containing protein [Clostridia bacterium]|nr:SIS domain-containing protein [Clostridia bacterium]MBQ4156522.1 SIS domain-containing protein [Clostridia bacterium]
MKNAFEAYYDSLLGILDKAFHSQAEALEKAATVISETLSDGGMVYTFGTGHAHMLGLEIFYRAGGPVKVYPILDEKLMLHISASESTGWERTEGFGPELLSKYPIKKGDALLLFSNSGRNAVPVQMALKAKEMGVTTIAITNINHSSSSSSRNSTGLRLFEAVDIVIDNAGVKGDACIDTPSGRKIGPTSTAVGAAILQALCCRAEEIARENGKTIEFYASSNIDGGDEINQKYIDDNKGVIKCL